MCGMLNGLPKCVERPGADGRHVEARTPVGQPCLIAFDPFGSITQPAKQQIVEKRRAVHHAGEKRGVLDQTAGVGRKIGKLGMFPNVVALCLAVTAAGQKGQQAVRVSGDQSIDDKLRFVRGELEMRRIEQIVGTLRQRRRPDLQGLAFGCRILAFAHARAAALKVAHRGKEIVSRTGK